MSAISFYLHSKKYVDVQYSMLDSEPLQISIGLSVDQALWENGKPSSKDQKALIGRIETAIAAYEADMRQADRIVLKEMK